MDPEGSLTGFAKDLYSADTRLREEAARQIWLRFEGRLRAVVTRRLDARLRSRSDADDVLQSLFADFFAAKPGPGGPPRTRLDLWRLLVHFTMCKVANTAERHRAARRDVRRERTLPDMDVQAGAIEDAGLGPEAEAIAREEFAYLLGLLPEDLRVIFVWKLEGCTNAEIASRIDRVERTVELKMKAIRAILENHVAPHGQ